MYIVLGCIIFYLVTVGIAYALFLVGIDEEDQDKAIFGAFVWPVVFVLGIGYYPTLWLIKWCKSVGRKK